MLVTHPGYPTVTRTQSAYAVWTTSGVRSLNKLSTQIVRVFSAYELSESTLEIRVFEIRTLNTVKFFCSIFLAQILAQNTLFDRTKYALWSSQLLPQICSWNTHWSGQILEKKMRASGKKNYFHYHHAWESNPGPFDC